MKEFLAELLDLPGVSGYEEIIARRISDEFSKYCDEVQTDSFYNVYGIKRGTAPKDGSPAPKVMLAAHMDEIALMVRDVTEEGFLRFTNIGGVDQRILLSQEVTIHGREKLFGIILPYRPISRGRRFKDGCKMKDMHRSGAACRSKGIGPHRRPYHLPQPLVSMAGSGQRKIH